MAAAGGSSFRSIVGFAATGIAKFLWGRAGIPVAGGVWSVQVSFTAGTGMQISGFSLGMGFDGIVGCGLCFFWHEFTNRTVAVR